MTAKKPRKRKSLRKQALKLTVEGKKTRIHFTLDQTNTPQAQLQTYNPNPDLIKFGTVGTGNKAIKCYAFKNQPNLIFFRIDDQFIPLNKHKLREVVALCSKAAWFIGLYGKRAKKYRGNLQA